MDFLATSSAARSCTSICLKIADPAFQTLSRPRQGEFIKSLVARLERESVAYDIGSYRDAPPGLRIWGGATTELSDLEALLPWLDWSYAVTRREVCLA